MIIIKIRRDYVTNSSSSSFILAFKNQKELDDFYEDCDYYDYEEFAKLIKHFEEMSNTKEENAQNLCWEYTYDYRRKLLEETIDRSKFPEFRDYLEEERRVEKEQWFQDKLEEYLRTTDFEEKLKQIDESEIVIDGMIWDTSGGILEWAIRNGFIEDNFKKYCVHRWNVG